MIYIFFFWDISNVPDAGAKQQETLSHKVIFISYHRSDNLVLGFQHLVLPYHHPFSPHLQIAWDTLAKPLNHFLSLSFRLASCLAWDTLAVHWNSPVSVSLTLLTFLLLAACRLFSGFSL
jgi:hypothetical protein